MKGLQMDYSKMLLPELKTLAKELGVKGFSTMKKAALVDYLSLMEKPEPKPKKVAPVESMVDAIKAALRNAREDRSNKGRNAAKYAVSTEPKLWQLKDLSFRLQRGSEHAKLTAKQARRVRGTQ
jgi:hypothetical protein